MNKIKFTDDKGNIHLVTVTQSKSALFKGEGLSRRKAFILARRKGWSHPKMHKGSATSYQKLF